jgi:hypothetical protein
MIGSEYHLVELIALADQDAWERYESVEWFAKRGIPDHTPRV